MTSKLLVVEDSPTQAAVIKGLLQNHNYQVTTVNDGKQALNAIKKGIPDLIISDILMPEMDGYELCKKIKSDSTTRDIPVILLTRLSDSEEILKGLSCGADCFISKPYDEKYLISQVENNLSPNSLSKNEKIPFSTQIFFNGKNRIIQAEQQNVIKLLINIYEEAIQRNDELLKAQRELNTINDRLESLVEDRTADLLAEMELSGQMADKLKKSEDKFRLMMENSADAIFVTDTKGTYLYTNIAASNMLGYTSGEFKKMSVADIAPFEKDDDYQTFLKKVISEGKIYMEVELIKKNGDLIPVDLNSVLLPDGTLYASFRDITERKSVQESLRKAKEVAEEHSRLKTAFLHNISHEIRTPMNAIVGFCTLLDEPDLEPQVQKSYINTIIQSSNHLLEIITDIVDIANIEANLVKMKKTEININTFLDELCLRFLPQAKEKKLGISYNSSLTDSEAMVLIDTTKVSRIVSNIMENALKFTDNGSIEVSCREKNDFLIIGIADTGIGISEEHHNKIFERFYRLQNSRTRFYEGIGLGLSIAKSYIELMEGQIWLESKPQEGSVFYFSIPVERIK